MGITLCFEVRAVAGTTTGHFPIVRDLFLKQRVIIVYFYLSIDLSIQFFYYFFSDIYFFLDAAYIIIPGLRIYTHPPHPLQLTFLDLFNFYFILDIIAVCMAKYLCQPDLGDLSKISMPLQSDHQIDGR